MIEGVVDSHLRKTEALEESPRVLAFRLPVHPSQHSQGVPERQLKAARLTAAPGQPKMQESYDIT